MHTTEPVTYDINPSTCGAHNPTPAATGKHFFTAQDWPPVELLVQALLH